MALIAMQSQTRQRCDWP